MFKTKKINKKDKQKKEKQKKEKQNLFFNCIVYLCTKES